MSKKIISLALVFVMVLSIVPFGVMGAEEKNSAWSKKTAFDEFESGKVLDRTPPWNMGGSTTGSSNLCKLVDDPQPADNGDKAIRLKSTSAASAVQASFDCNLGDSGAFTTDMVVSASVLANETTKVSLKVFGVEKSAKKEAELITIKDGKIYAVKDGKLADTGAEVPLGQWFDLYVTIELGEKAFSVSVDGEAVTNDEGDEAFTLPYAFKSIYRAGFFSAGANSETHIDDFTFATAEAGEKDTAGGDSEKSPATLDKWENNITVINSVLKDRLVMAEGSPKFFNNMVAGHYVEGNNNVCPVHRGDAYIVPARSVAGSLGLEFAWDDAAKKVTFKKDGKTTTMTLGSTSATVAGAKATLSAAPEMVNGALMVPVNEIAAAAGKKVFIDDGDIKLIVIGATAKPFNSRKKQDVLTEIARATYYERPDAQKVMADFKATPRASQHPRLYVTKDKIAEIKTLVKTDPFMKEAYAEIKKEAQKIVKRPLPAYSETWGKAGTSRYMDEEIQYMMMVYWVDGFNEYLEKSINLAMAFSEFPHYGPYSSLAEADAAVGLAIAYDWLYDYLTPEQRQKIKTALVEKRMKDDLLKYQRQHPNSSNTMKGGWVDWGNNFTTDGNKGVMFAIGAVWDEEPELCKQLLKYFFRSMETAFVEISPDGGGREGIGYLLAGTVSQSITSFRILTELAGTDYNYLTAPHFKKALESKLYMYGSGGVFRYGDEGREKGSHYPYFTWIGKYMSPRIYEERLRELRDYPEAASYVLLDLIDYDPNFVGSTDNEDLDLGIMYRKSEAGAFRNSWNNHFNTFLGFKGGDSVMSHSHRDLGSFVFQTDGVPWFDDHGMITWAYANSGAALGSEMYNHRAEGHNVMLFRNVDDLKKKPASDADGMLTLNYFDMEDIPIGGTPTWKVNKKGAGKLEVVEEDGDKVLLMAGDSTGTSLSEMLLYFNAGLCTEGFALEYDIKINHMEGTTASVNSLYGMQGEFYDAKSPTNFRPIQACTPEELDGFKYEKDTWYHVKLVFDLKSMTYDFYVDGKKVHGKKSFMLPAGYNLYVIQITTSAADIEYMLDDFKFSVKNNNHNFQSVSENLQKKDDQLLSAVSKLQNYVNGEGAAFATADLGAVYPDYTKDYKRAFGLFNNREVMVIRDEATVVKDCETWWFGHTVYDIQLSEDGKSAILTDPESGIRLWVGIMTNGPEKFTTMPTEPFPESPRIDAEVKEGMFAGKQKLTIMNNRKKGEKIALTIMATPLYEGETAPSNLPAVKPISEWKDEPYTGARLPDLLVDGVSLDGFDPNQRYYEVTYKRYDIDPPLASIPKVSVPAGVNAVVKQAEKVGDRATITVGEGSNARTYYVVFKEIVEIYIDPASIPVFEPSFAPTGKIINAGDYTFAQDSIRRSYGFTSETSVRRIDSWFDGDFETNHSVSPFEAFEDIDFGQTVSISKLEIAFANGDKRQDIFSLYSSMDGENWECVLAENMASGKGKGFETFSFPTINTRWLRIVSHGNSAGSQFCNISEMRIRK